MNFAGFLTKPNPDMKKGISLLVAALLGGNVLAQAPDSIGEKTSRSEDNVDVTGVPLLSFDRSRGFGIGGVGVLFFRIEPNEKTPPSLALAAAAYTTKNNWMAFGLTQLYFKDNNYRLTAGGGYLNSNFQTYQDYGDMDNVQVPYTNKGMVIHLSPMIRLHGPLYAGINVGVFRSDLTLHEPDGSDSESKNWVNGLGVGVLYDTRDNPYNATRGVSASLRFNVYPSWFGNDSVFNKVLLQANYYHRIDPTKVIASRVAVNAAIGPEVPFVAQVYVGGHDIRGYTKGEYRGNQVYSAQSELRWNVYRRWGAVGFFGLALASSPEQTSQLLPGGGVGARFVALPKYNVNFGLDAAVGHNDWGIYFRITEAF